MEQHPVRRDTRFPRKSKNLLQGDALLEAGWNALKPLLEALNLPNPVPCEDVVVFTQTHTTGAIPHTSDGAVAELLYAAIPPSVMADPGRARTNLLNLLRDPTSLVIPRRIRAMQQRGEFRAITRKANCSVPELLACFCEWVLTRGHETRIITGDAFGGASHVYRSYPPLWAER